jgi:NADP-dependent 3-hydroxy acid dehydrogenase YdfG
LAPPSTRSGDLEGKVAWITGGGSGIGLAGALEFARAGAHVVISGRSRETLFSSEKQLKAAGSGEVMAMDVSDQKEVAKTAAAILKRMGRIDILVNSAGINSPKRNFHNVSLESWDQIVAINLSGMFYCCHAVLPAMRARKDGLVINISSWAGRYASTLTGPGYNSTKSAVVALTESINMEECANGIRATSVLPGEVATPILEKRPVPPSQEERGRMLQAEDLGRTLLFVATMPARACVNEILISPTWNRFYVGGLEKPKN